MTQANPTGEVVATLAGAASALDNTPMFAQVVFLPMMATSGTVADLASALTTSSLLASRNLVARGLNVIGWG